jgi:hypothetical protein
VELHPLRLILVLLLVAGAIYGGHEMLFSSTEAPSGRMSGMSGVVEHRSRGAGWHRAREGGKATGGDWIRTGRAGGVALSLPSDASVTLGEETEVLLAAVEATVQEIRLGRGFLKGDVAQSPRRVLRVAVDGAHARVETIGGSFELRCDGRGEIALRAIAGDVRFAEAGRVRRLRAGRSLTRHRLRPRSLPRPGAPVIPRTAILKAGWPRPVTPTARHGSAGPGKTEVGAIVSIRGVRLGEPKPRESPPSVPAAKVAEPPAPSPSKTERASARPRRRRLPPPAPKVHVPAWE